MKIERTSPAEGYIEVTEEEYREQLAAGRAADEAFQPGRHRYIRGGFRKHHPDFDSATVKVTVEVTLSLDYEVLEYFKQQAQLLQADSYQAPMAQVLRSAMEGGAASRKPVAKKNGQTNGQTGKRRRAA